MKNLRLFLLIAVAALSLLMGSPAVSASAESPQVYVGGNPVGISLDVGGLLVESVTGVETEYGTAYVEGLNCGDIIKEIDGTAVRNIDDVQDLLRAEPMKIVLERAGDILTVEATPLIETYSGKPKLGVRIKDRIYGIGTLSFVRQSGDYAALGHEIYDSETKTHIPFSSGKLHGCKILGVKKGNKGEAGALLGSLVADSDLGTITCNNNFGIAGCYNGKCDMGDLIQVADRTEVKPGPAKIRTTIADEPEYFDVEIIKASHRAGRREKGIVFRVTDKRLLDITGGVVRGMSGSPIIQNGKLVGAVTHVFLNDFTKGYGVYADCLN